MESGYREGVFLGIGWGCWGSRSLKGSARNVAGGHGALSCGAGWEFLGVIFWQELAQV